MGSVGGVPDVLRKSDRSSAPPFDRGSHPDMGGAKACPRGVWRRLRPVWDCPWPPYRLAQASERHSGGRCSTPAPRGKVNGPSRSRPRNSGFGGGLRQEQIILGPHSETACNLPNFRQPRRSARPLARKRRFSRCQTVHRCCLSVLYVLYAHL